MLQVAVFSCFLSLVGGQVYIPHEHGLVDTIHGYAVHYDDDNNYILFVDADQCYVMLTPPEEEARWDLVMRDPTLLHQYTDEVYNQIVDNDGIRRLQHWFADEGIHGPVLSELCSDLFKKYIVTYTGTVGE